MTRHRPWVVVRRGVYVERDAVGGLGPYDARPALRDRAAQLVMTVPHVLSHDSAARAHGLPMLRPKRRAQSRHATRRGRLAHRFGVKHHLRRPCRRTSSCRRTTTSPGSLGWPSTSAGSTASRPAPWPVTARCDVASPGQSWRRSSRACGAGPNITRVARGGRARRPGCRDRWGVPSRILLEELGTRPVETQFAGPTAHGHGLVRPADRLSCLRVRRSGEVPRDQRTAASPIGPADEVVWEEKKRERLIRAEGLGVSRDHLGGPLGRRSRAGLGPAAGGVPPHSRRASARSCPSTSRRTRRQMRGCPRSRLG